MVVGQSAISDLLQEYLRRLADHTKRDVVLYASHFNSPQQDAGIVPEDITGFMEALHGLRNDKLDLVIHSPGGSAEAAEQIVTYLRCKFKHIRAIIPQSAMSAATMLCCGCDEIVMGKQSALGPIDPQFFIPTQAGGRWVAGQSLVEEFNMAKAEVIQNPQAGPAWFPILSQYPPGVLQEVDNSTKLGTELVKRWLNTYMFANKEQKGEEIASYLSNHGEHRSHARPIDRSLAVAKGLAVLELEADGVLQDLVLSVQHLVTHTFNMSPVYKIIENQDGKAFLRMSGPP